MEKLGGFLSFKMGRKLVFHGNLEKNTLPNMISRRTSSSHNISRRTYCSGYDEHACDTLIFSLC